MLNGFTKYMDAHGSKMSSQLFAESIENVECMQDQWLRDALTIYYPLERIQGSDRDLVLTAGISVGIDPSLCWELRLFAPRHLVGV